MSTVFDVAAYILRERGEMTAMKLQKLVYYAYAWHLVWEGEKLFDERIEAWANGPVVRELYKVHRGQFKVKELLKGDSNAIARNKPVKSSVDAVLKFYGDKTPFFLSELTHSEEPWKKARKGLGVGEHGRKKIKDAWMEQYYSALV
ncbi:MAG: DUF4065 domain-containing protein [Deltaproteobacteria bacterium]|nr:DUF4065 domain-containing protein [Deltaproteobacteria bacterium]